MVMLPLIIAFIICGLGLIFTIVAWFVDGYDTEDAFFFLFFWFITSAVVMGLAAFIGAMWNGNIESDDIRDRLLEREDMTHVESLYAIADPLMVTTKENKYCLVRFLQEAEKIEVLTCERNR